MTAPSAPAASPLRPDDGGERKIGAAAGDLSDKLSFERLLENWRAI
jgi:hypothetical protein